MAAIALLQPAETFASLGPRARARRGTAPGCRRESPALECWIYTVVTTVSIISIAASITIIGMVIIVSIITAVNIINCQIAA